MVASKTGIKLGLIIDTFHLDVLYGPEGYRERLITIEDVNRPGLQLTGFFDYFDKERMQLLGLVEISYLEGISAEKRAAVFDTLFSYHTPAVIFARGLKPYPECMEMAKKHSQVILSTQENTANIMSTLIAYLRTALSPIITRHGVLVEVYGEGVLLAGSPAWARARPPLSWSSGATASSPTTRWRSAATPAGADRHRAGADPSLH